MSEIRYKNELMLVQNELLKDMKNLENRLDEKLKEEIKLLNDENININKRLKQLENSYNLLIQQTETEKTSDNSKENDFLSKIELLNRKIQDNNTTLEIKLSNLKNELNNICYKYDRAIADNFQIPGIVGLKAPFQNIRQLLRFREKQTLDLKKYKEKIDNALSMNNNKFSILESKITTIFDIKLKDLEKNCYERFNKIEERINSMRIENGKYSDDINAKCEDLDEKFKKNDEILKKYFDETREEFTKY